MTNVQLLEYVKQQLAQGTSKDVIHANLVSSGGWSPSDINEAFDALESNTPLAPIAPSIPMAPAASTTITTDTPASVAPTVKYAGFWIRWVAVMIDSLVLIVPLGLIQFALAFPLIFSGIPQIAVQGISYLISTLVTWTYFVLMTHHSGSTLGKKLVGITVKSEDLQKLPLGKLLIRETIGKFVSGFILCIGHLIAAFTKKKQALHDKFAGSVVVYKNADKPLSTGVIVAIAIAAIIPTIAILGILSSVVLASLNTARDKGEDASMKASISMMGAAAEMHFEANGSYTSARDCQSGMFADTSMRAPIMSLKQSSERVECYSNGVEYAMSAKLNENDKSYCIDSAGYRGDGTAADTGVEVSCQSTGSLIKPQQSEATGDTVNNPYFSFTLPSEWRINPTAQPGMTQAAHEVEGSVVTIVSIPLPAEMSNVTSITELLNPDNMDPIIKSGFPSATMIQSELSTFGGKEAIKTTFNMEITAAVEGTFEKTEDLSVLEYDVVSKGSAYSIVFISSSRNQQSASSDFQSIINGFTFK